MVDKSKIGKVTKSSEKKVKMQQSLAKPEVSDLIAARLRSFYDDVSKQPVPDRFIELLNKLQASQPPEKKT